MTDPHLVPVRLWPLLQTYQSCHPHYIRDGTTIFFAYTVSYNNMAEFQNTYFFPPHSPPLIYPV